MKEHLQWMKVMARKDQDVVCVLDREAAAAAVTELLIVMKSGLPAVRAGLINSVIVEISEKLNE